MVRASSNLNTLRFETLKSQIIKSRIKRKMLADAMAWKDARMWRIAGTEAGDVGSARLKNCPAFFWQEIYYFKIQKCFIQKCIFQKKVGSVRSEKCIFHAFVFVLPLNNNDSHFKILCSHLHSLWFWHNEEIKLEEKIILGAKDQKWLFIKSEEKIM